MGSALRNLVIASLALALLGAMSCGGAPHPPAGDVVLVILDTVRADHLSVYGYLRETTPNLDRLAAEGVRYDDAWAQAPWTLPAITTILTGQPPHVHGADRLPTGVHPLRDDVRTLAERMSAAGYGTAAFINVIWCSPRISGLDRGFGTYDFRTSDESNVGQRNAAETTRAALDWLKGAGDDPVFMVVHYFDAHLTYDPPPPFDTMFEETRPSRIPRGFGSKDQVFGIRRGSIRLDPGQRKSLVARYDGEIRFIDEQFGALRRGLEERGRWDGALVVVVGDHGEEFWDHGGFEHGHTHHREMMRIPLILKRPGGSRGEVSSRRVRQLEIAPTVLDFAGLPVPGDLPGGILDATDAVYAVGEGSLWGGDLVSARADAGTLMLRRDTGALRFYGPDDPFEHSPLDGEEHADPTLLQLLRALPVAPSRPNETRELTEEQLDRLRSLGYVE